MQEYTTLWDTLHFSGGFYTFSMRYSTIFLDSFDLLRSLNLLFPNFSKLFFDLRILSLDLAACIPVLALCGELGFSEELALLGRF